MIVARFRAFGRPVPQGSMRERVVRRKKLGQRTRFVVHDQAEKLYVWRQTIATAARAVGVRTEAATAAFKVSATFYLSRPESPVIRLTDKRDLDKYLRALLDALTRIAWLDDGQVVTFGLVEKKFATDAEPPGVAVTLEVLA